MISGYVLCFENGGLAIEAVRSILAQTYPVEEILVIDDGSVQDAFPEQIDPRVSVIRFPQNLGRGAARAKAMEELKTDLIVSCDATNRLPVDYVERLAHWFEDPKVAGVHGWIQDAEPRGGANRWRSRHLFKANYPMSVRHQAPLITSGLIARRSCLMGVGNYQPSLRHTEDGELGERLLSSGYDIVFDPSVPVFCNIQNTLAQVLERYWRWYAGPDERISWRGYWRNVVFSVKGMAWQDLMAGDPLAALISLLCPHYQFWKSWTRRRRVGTRRQRAESLA